MRFFSVALAAALLTGTAASAQNHPKHSIPWFAMAEHTGARLKALDLCRNDHRFYANPQTAAVCENAEKAETRVYYNNKNMGLKIVDTVNWWKENDFLRQSTLNACRRRAPYDRDALQYCDVANRAQNELRR